MMFSKRLKSLPFLALIALASSCAWGYAGEEGKVTAEPQPEASTKVVEFEDSPPADKQLGQQADEQEGRQADQQQDPHDAEPQVVRESDSPQVTEPQSPCGVSMFTIRRYTAAGVVEKTIDCVERKAVSVKRMPMSDAQFQKARKAGLPEGTWFLLVDPKGLRAKYVSNAELIKISKQFEVEYLQKDRRRNLLIYEYRDAVR